MFEKFELVQNMVIYSYTIYSIDERYLNKLCCWDSWSYLVVLGRTWSYLVVLGQPSCNISLYFVLVLAVIDRNFSSCFWIRFTKQKNREVVALYCIILETFNSEVMKFLEFSVAIGLSSSIYMHIHEDS